MGEHSGRPAGTTGTPSALGLAERPVPALASAPRPRKGAARPAPERSDDFAHLSLDALRDYRAVLSAEESKVSYWRRILQARLDVVRAGGGRELDPASLRPVLTGARVGAGRQVLVEVLQLDDIPPLPNLGELWERRVPDGDHAERDVLAADLGLAEAQLSAYRAALHQRIAAATDELIARYREQPTLCLTALPLGPARRATA